MTAISRDKIALVVFAGLLFLGTTALIGYIQLGHSWNVAASNIDDVTGTMDGYTTIIYKGTVPPGAKPLEDDEGNDDIGEPSDKTLPASKSPLDDTDPPNGLDSPVPDNSQPASSYEKGVRATEGETSALAAEKKALLQELLGIKGTENLLDAAAKSTDLIPEDPLFGLDINEPDDLVVGPGANSSSAKKMIDLDIHEVENSYLKKQSNVIVLDTEDPLKYRDGLIVRKGNTRIGVFNVFETDTTFKIEQQVNAFNTYAVDFVVAITPSKKLVEGARGIDIVISTCCEKIFVMGETIEDTFYVAAPTKGSVGAILISPSNVVSAKVLTEI